MPRKKVCYSLHSGSAETHACSEHRLSLLQSFFTVLLEAAYPRSLKVLVDALFLASTYIILSSHSPLHQCAQAPSTGSPCCCYRTTGRFTSSPSSVNSFSRWGRHLSWMFFFSTAIFIPYYGDQFTTLVQPKLLKINGIPKFLQYSRIWNMVQLIRTRKYSIGHKRIQKQFVFLLSG